MIKLAARELRRTKPKGKDLKRIKKNPIYIILDNVLDTYNVGAIFRLADAVSAKKVILCGETETPPHTRIKKASINTTEWVSWEYAETAVKAIERVKDLWNCHPDPSVDGEGSQHSMTRDSSPSAQNDRRGMIVAIEQSEKSVPYDKVDYRFPLALVVGNETTGVSKEVLEMVDQIVELPMWGVNKSLNVMVSLGIVLYEAMRHKK